jgi:hypothetical protein
MYKHLTVRVITPFIIIKRLINLTKYFKKHHFQTLGVEIETVTNIIFLLELNTTLFTRVNENELCRRFSNEI